MAGSAPHIPGCRDLSLIGERVARSLFSGYSDRLGRPVTVTVFPPLADGRTRDAFDRAAATAQRLGAHPSVLTIHEWGQAHDGRPWVITDPQPADSVDVLLTLDGPLEIERALQVGILLAGALETAHRAGIVHGDLQPARLVFGNQGEPLLVETGLAPFAVFPGLGALNNPVRYHAPPEVLERTEVSPATDVYSLATTIYALLAGRAPHQKPAEVTDSNASLLLRILQMPVPPIGRPGLPAGLDDALRGPLSASPDKRPQQAIEVAWLLQDVQRRAGLPVTEPVVLDLDEIAGSRAGGAAGGSPRPAVEHPAPAHLSDAGSRTDRAAPSWSLPAAGLAGAGAAAMGASHPEEPDEVLPPPTVFPFAASGDGRDDAWPPGGEPGAAAAEAPSPWAPVDPPADSPWSGLSAGSAGLWTAPDDARAAETPWASAPADTPTETPWAATPTDTPTETPWAATPTDTPTETPWAAAPADTPTESPWAGGTAEAPWATPAPGASPWGAPDTTGGAATDATDHMDQSAEARPWSGTTGTEPGARTPGPVDPGGEVGPPDGRPAAPATDGADTLWPSTWPAGGHGTDAPDLPAWAAPLRAGDDELPEHAAASDGPTTTWAAGGDGGSIADAAPTGGADAGPAPQPFGSPSAPRPPELDELPSWYTDPLPNAAPPSNGNGTNGARGALGEGPTAWPPGDGGGAQGPSPHGSPNGGHPGGSAGRPDASPPSPAPWAGGDLRGGTGPAPDPRRLPGAGDELRSLFGEVVGEPDTTPDRPRPSAFDDDPLGPPEARPPIDLGQLDRPLGPAPYLPPASARAETPAAERPARLPRRHEPQTWPSPTSRPDPPARLPRASEVPDASPARSPRPGPRQVAGADAPGAIAGVLRPSATAGPPALPVVILVVVVVVLALGVAWLVLTGDDGGTPATDRDVPAGEQSGEAGAAAPTGVEATAVPEGVQVSWSGVDGAEYVVTVLSPDAPPEQLPPTRSTSALVPNVEGAAPGGRCFMVAVAAEQGATATASEPVCTAGATVDQMVQG